MSADFEIAGDRGGPHFMHACLDGQVHIIGKIQALGVVAVNFGAFFQPDAHGLTLCIRKALPQERLRIDLQDSQRILSLRS